MFSLSGTVSFSDSRILQFGLGPETLQNPASQGRIVAPRTRNTASFALEESPTSAPGWKAGCGASSGAIGVSRKGREAMEGEGRRKGYLH